MPASLVANCLVTPVSVFRIVTVVPGTTAPDASVTRPRMSPELVFFPSPAAARERKTAIPASTRLGGYGTFENICVTIAAGLLSCDPDLIMEISLSQFSPVAFFPSMRGVPTRRDCVWTRLTLPSAYRQDSYRSNEKRLRISFVCLGLRALRLHCYAAVTNVQYVDFAGRPEVIQSFQEAGAGFHPRRH